MALSFLLALSAPPVNQASTSGSLETTRELSKVGGRAEAETGRPTRFSDAFTTSQILTSAFLSHATSPAGRTQRTAPPEDSTRWLLVSSQQSAFQTLSGNLSSTSTADPLTEQGTSNGGTASIQARVPPVITTNHIRQSASTPGQLPSALPSAPSRPSAYSPNLTPQPSPLRPHCLTRDRLRLWRPSPDINSRHILAEEGELEWVFIIISNAESTHETYSAGILVYHVFCDVKNIPEELHAPANQSTITTFIVSLAGSYFGSTISNYIHGLRAWRVLHGLEWRLNSLEMDAALKGADRLTPPSSKRKKRQPYTTVFITKLRQQLNVNDSLDAAIFACLTTCFYAAARVGEFVIPQLDAFSPSSQVTTANLCVDRDSNGLEVTVLHIPSIKAAPLEGEDVFWSSHPGPTNPYAALENHLRVNYPTSSDHLFAYRHKEQLHPLTKPAFIKRLASAARQAGLEPLQGHGIRIGATLFYLLHGLPIEAVKIMGRWSSDAFLIYLRKHAQVLTPFIQADPKAHKSL